MTNEAAIDELERALRAAAPAPWVRFRVLRETGWVYAVIPKEGTGGVAESLSEADSAAIAALRNSASSLLSDSRALLEARKLLEEVLENVHWRGDLAERIAAFLGDQNGKD